MTATPRRCASPGSRITVSRPSRRMLPASGRWAPASTLMSVLLPAPFSPSRANTSPARNSKSTPRSACTPGKDFSMPRISSSGTAEVVSAAAMGRTLLERRIGLGVGPAVERGGNQHGGRNRLAGEMFDDGADSFNADLVRELDRVGVDFPLFDGLPAFRLAVEANDMDSGLGRFFQGGASAERGRIVDRKNASQIGMSLKEVFGGLVTLVFHAAAWEFGHDLDFARGAAGIVLLDDLPEPIHAQDARLNHLVMQNGDFAARLTQRFDHGLGRLAAAAQIVGGDVRHDLRAGSQARNVGGEHGDARVVGLLNGRADGLGIARRQDDGRDFFNDEILHLILLFGHVELAAHHADAVSVLAGLVGHAVGDLLEKWISQGQHGEADDAFVFRLGGAGDWR